MMNLKSCIVLFGLGIGLAAAADRPNVVVVLFDDLGYGQPPAYNPSTEFKMPHLDRVVREGMRFTDAHSASAVCTPTRYGLLTGRSPFRIGQFGVLTTFSGPIISTNRVTIASLLRGRGYRTAAFGKWHLGLEWDPGHPRQEELIPIGTRVTGGPNALGFDRFYGFTHARNIGMFFRDDRVAEKMEPVETQPRLTEAAVACIEEFARLGEPFFVYFPMCPPHTPVVPAAEFIGQSGAVDHVKHDARYGDWILQGDHMLGRILDALDRTGAAEETLLIVTSDNGAEGRAYAPLRGSKRSIYEGGHRVPFVVRWPGRVVAGTVNAEPVALNDLLATVAEVVGVALPPDAGEDSASLLATLTGQATRAVHEAFVTQSSSGDLAIRQGFWKLIQFKDGRQELYDLEHDLGEQRDLRSERPEVVDRLSRLMQRYRDEGRSCPPAPTTG